RAPQGSRRLARGVGQLLDVRVGAGMRDGPPDEVRTRLGKHALEPRAGSSATRHGEGVVDGGPGREGAVVRRDESLQAAGAEPVVREWRAPIREPYEREVRVA